MGTLTIPESSLVYVDTAIVIYSVEKIPDYFPLLETLWLELNVDKLKVISNELTLMETWVLPLRNRNSDLIQIYESLLLASDIQAISVTQAVLKAAAHLRAATSLRTPDAIHAATAMSEKYSVFLTNDADFRKVPNLPVVALSDVL
ncbi:MAG: PIN domain-containing protein [Stenomitos rutilans HA7619-LM2]|jgi:predicted nucleic acid-binding protein|nr:PIN domain-containing protein [Stenomitos rutilans HA7619-LM2]